MARSKLDHPPRVGARTQWMGNVFVNWWTRRIAPALHFRMWANLREAHHHPSCFSFRNSGTGPVHITSIEGDNGFTLADFFDPVTIDVDPEPTEFDAPAPFVKLMAKRPTRIFAVDSAGKRWPLPKSQLQDAYRFFEEFRTTDEYKNDRGNCNCCNDDASEEDDVHARRARLR